MSETHPDFSAPELTPVTGDLVTAAYTVTDEDGWDFYPDNGWVTVLEVNTSPGLQLTGSLSAVTDIPLTYGVPSKVRVRAYHFTEGSYGEWSEWSDPITLNAPELAWVATGQFLDRPEPVHFTGTGPPDGTNTAGAVFSDTYTDTDTGLFYELSAAPTESGGPPDTPTGLVVTSTDHADTGEPGFAWPPVPRAQWYSLYWRYFDLDPPDPWGVPMWTGIDTCATLWMYFTGSLEFGLLAHSLVDDEEVTSPDYAVTGEVVIDTGSTGHSPDTPPGAVVNFAADTTSVPDEVTFSWETDPDTRLGDAEHYLIQASETTLDVWGFIDPSVPFGTNSVAVPVVATYVHNELVPGTYDFRVLSISEYGDAYSDVLVGVEVV